MLSGDRERFTRFEGDGGVDRAPGNADRPALVAWATDDLDGVIYSLEETSDKARGGQ